MKILRVLTRPNVGGPTRQAEALWHAHAELGHETRIVTGVCESGEPSLDWNVPASAHVVIPELRRSISPWRDRCAGRELRREIESFAPDVIHSHTSKAGLLARPLGHRLGVPVVHTYHGIVLRDYYPSWLSWWMARTERRLARRTNRNLAVSASCRDELLEFGIESEVVAPAVAVEAGDRATARRAFGVDRDAFVVGFVGRLVAIKRVGRFVEAVRRIPGAIGVVVGDGPERRALDGEPKIRHLGATADARSLVAGFDVLAMPSVREGFPLAVVEATASGVPAVGFDVPGVRDAVRSAGGQLVAADSSDQDFARAIEAARGTPVDPRVVNECAPRRIAERLVTVYRSMLGS